MIEDSKSTALSSTFWSRLTTSPFSSPTLFLLILVCELGTLLLRASRRRFWFDELFTFHVSGLHPFSSLMQALKVGVDGMPPAYYAMVELARLIPVDPHTALRLPSICGYMLTLLGVYWFAEKSLPVLAGPTAVLLVSLSPFRDYALEARSYSLLVGFLAIAAVCWQRVDSKRFMALMLAVSLGLAVSCHHLAVVTISVFGVAELSWTAVNRRFRWKVWIACITASLPFFLDLPILLNFRKTFGKNFWAKPSLSSVVHSYSFYLGLDLKVTVVFILFFAILFAMLLLQIPGGPKRPRSDAAWSLPESVLVGGFLFYPALLIMLTMLAHSGYTARYGWPAIIGATLAALYFLRPARPLSSYLVVALLVAFVIQLGGDFATLPRRDSIIVDERWAHLASVTTAEPQLPIVIASGITFLEADKYSPPELHDRLVELVDEQTAIRMVGTDSIDKGNLQLASYVPLRIENRAQFEAAHPKFYVYSGGNRDWLTHYLLENKYNLKLISDVGSNIYLVER